VITAIAGLALFAPLLGGLTAMNADALFRIVAKGEIELEGEVPESRLGALRPGQGVRVEIASMAPVQGHVRLVPAEIDRMTRLARVRVALPVGQHEVVFRHPQLGEQRETAVVKSGALTQVSVTLTSAPLPAPQSTLLSSMLCEDETAL